MAGGEKSHSFLIMILILAGAIRFVGLSENPPGLFRDETDKAYTTYSLLETGKDLAGRTWPLQIKAFGAYTSPLYHWFSLPFIGVFGVGVWTTRLVAALAGTCACFGVYLLGRDLAGNRAGLFSALLLAVSPWHFLFSRWANQGILMTLFMPLAAWATWKAIRIAVESEGTPWKWIFLAGMFWALGWIAYAPARLFVPLLLFTLLGIELFQKQNRFRGAATVFLVGAATVVFILPFLIDLFLNWNETQTRLKFLAGDRPLSLSTFLGNYFLHWDPRYLFWFGDANPRHHAFSRSGFGQITWLEGAACLAGIAALIKTPGRVRGWLLAWIVLAPVPAAITQEGLPHALRTLMIVPAFALLGGIGLARVVERAPEGKKLFAKAGLGLAFLLQTGVGLYLFSLDYPDASGPYWEAGTLEAFELVESSRREDEVCAVTGLIEYPECFVYFTRLPDPRRVQQGLGTEGYEFLPTGMPFDPASSNRKGLFLLRAGEIRKPLDWKEIRPDPPNEKLERAWRLYRSEKAEGAAAP